jgi:hypothetical protein
MPKPSIFTKTWSALGVGIGTFLISMTLTGPGRAQMTARIVLGRDDAITDELPAAGRESQR